MLLFIIRHGDPIYDPDSLTEKGKLQANALAKRLALYGIDKIYSSPLIRARQTAEPTEILTGKKAQIEEWTNEHLTWDDFTFVENGRKNWIFQSEIINEIRKPSIYERGLKWYDDPLFSEIGINGKVGYERILNASDEFLARHGYFHDREDMRYIAKEPNDERIAVFCHQGFGLCWLGTLLDIPLPMVWSVMDICHSGMTVIEFKATENGLCTPKMLTLSNDSHLYRESLPTKYNNRIFF